METQIMDKVVALAKRRGFIYPGSELYGGLANTYDYGPVGTELLRNIRNAWWRNFVHKRPDIVGIDAGIISHHKVWEASGHVAGFADAMIDCKNCKARMRADHLLENFIEELDLETKDKIKISITENKELTLSEFDSVLETGKVEGMSIEGLELLRTLFSKNGMKCPNCGKNDWTSIRKFNLLFPVQLGIVEGEKGYGYLRGETAQSIFINFKNVVDSTRVRLPFGIAQIGKSFRNEITPGNSVFRTVEFEQAELEYFFDPDTSDWKVLYENWKESMETFVTQKLGVRKSNIRWREHTQKERSFYSKRTEDLEYKFPFGYKELWGLAYRTNYDLSAHMQVSKRDLSIVDPGTGKKIVPHVIEPAVGINRLFLMVLIDAFKEEEKRIVLKLHPRMAPYKAAIFPLLANKENLVTKAKNVFEMLAQHHMIAFDDRGNIGKRYMAQDEIGTPWCITIDFQTIEDNTVTIRDRDTMEQERIPLDILNTYISGKLGK